MVRGATFVLVIIGSAALADPLPALGLLPKLPATVEVAVVDRETGEQVVGATVVATPMFAPRVSDEVKVTDHIGLATLDVASVPTRLTIMYSDATWVTYVEASAPSRRLAIHVPHVDVSAPPDPCPRDPTAFATPHELASLASAVVAHAPQIADGHFLTKPVVMESIPGVVGVRGAKPMSHTAIERDADRTGTDQPYLAIDQLELGAKCAKVETRISIIQPRAKRRDLLCCCTSTDVYRRLRDGSWAFMQNLGAICS